MKSSLLGVYSTKVEVEALKCASYEPGKQNLNHLRSAYYTTRAPFMPLQIGFLGERPENTNDQRLMQLIKNIKTIEIDNCKAEHLNITTTLNISPKEHRGHIQLVHLILRDLVDNLPLVLFSRNSSPKRIVSSTGPCLSPTRKQKEDIVPRTKGPVSSSSPTNTINAAIQTWKIKSISDGTDRCIWQGGVRALRNSLVRLVLRQMQHVDRLNRTLDHVHKTGQKFVY
ncbi:uncharacterized protein LOC113228038 isoform X1 [Hyposmocoma kahamanoa]|uniref:uncharacterized protein LOC113228038 isoform X1 n=1 Tax=Hyposmocoma kahamanoa TaxID=1477025 RepID=UPI000E6DA2BB|nr:uncharacterized protein LOC113228038 isoform X1 [Hyposmocoma kahamanoa]